MDNPPHYHLILRSERSSVPAIIRLRKLLKTSLRAFGLRCVSIQEVREPSAGELKGNPELVLRK